MRKCCCLQWFIMNNLLNFCSACFRDPHYPDDYIFEAKLLPNVTMPPRTLKGEGVLGPYQPQIGFSQRQGPGRSYSTPEPARRWGNQLYRQEELGWNSSSPYEQRAGYAERQRSDGGAYAWSPSPGGGQSSHSFNGYDQQWSSQQSPWRRQSGELVKQCVDPLLPLPVSPPPCAIM